MGTVDRHVNNGGNNPHLLPPTPGEIEKLVEKLRKMNLQVIPEETHPANHRRLNRRFSEGEVGTILARYEAGETISSLSRELKVSRQALRRLLKARDATFRKQGMSSEDADQAVQLYESGLTIDEVVDRVGYSYGVINRMLHKRGVNVRPRGHQE